MTFLGKKPDSDTSLPPAWIPSLAFRLPENGDRGLHTHSLWASLNFLKATKT